MGDSSVGLILDVDRIAEYKKVNYEDHTSFTHPTTEHIPEETKNHNDGEDHILFTLSKNGIYSIPLDEIYRLEELPTNKFTSIRGKKNIIYRDEVMPLTEANMLSTHNTENENSDSESRTTIIIRYQDHFYGILVKNILGIRNIKGKLDKNIHSRDKFLGSYCLDDCVITVMDIYKILGVTHPSNQVHNAHIDKKNELSQSEIKGSWGMF